MKGIIFDIKKFAVHDGDGVRTTVFLKGCPLKCVWCHNPEGISPKECLAFYPHKCVNCGACSMVCPCHKFENGIHSFDNSECVACGKCVKACNSEALYLFGKVIDTDELVPILLEDKAFYDNSNGGITLSGGECLMQASFCRELLEKMKAHGIHTAVDTSGFVGREAIEKVLPYTDLFLYDIKAFSKEVHEKCTGHTNEIILENLKYIDEMDKKVEIRIPCVPEYNFGELNAIAEFLKTLKNPVKVRLLPYHNYAGTKYASLCMKNTLPAIIPGESEMKKAREVFENWGIDVLN